MAPNGNGEGVRPTTITAWQLIGTAVAVMGAMGVSIWTIISDQNAANERILTELHSGYITKAQHEDLSSRLTREVARVDELGRATVTRPEWESYRSAQKDLQLMQDERLRDLTARLVEQIAIQKADRALTMPRDEFDRWQKAHDAMVSDMKKRIEEMTATHLSRGEFNAWRDERGKTVDSMQKQIDELMIRNRQDGHAAPSAPR